MAQIICIATERWQQIPTRTQRLLPTEADVELLYFEPSIPLFPLRDRKWKRPKDGDRRQQNVTLYTLPCSVSLSEDYVTRAPLEFRRISAFVRAAMGRNRFERPVLWCCTPVCAGLLDAVPHSSVVYDCDRSWENQAPAEWESALCDAADVVFAASPLLYQRLEPLCHNITLLPNGHSSALFGSIRGASLRAPADLSAIPGPILGVLGNCSETADLSPLLYAANAMPDCSFVIVGEVSHYNAEYNAAEAQKNLYILGEKSRVSLPHYLGHFDVCIELPGTDPGDSVLPERFYAYLQTGAPIVTLTESSAQDQYTDVVYPAHFDIEFLDACRRALNEESRLLSSTRRAYAAESDWSARTEACRHILHATAIL